jgi:uncharacterized protein
VQRKKVPLRKCVACQEMKPKKSLLRIVRTPEGDIRLDLTGKQSGRGAYMCATEECLSLAQKKKALERSLKTKLSEDVYAILAEHMQKVGWPPHE